MNLFKPTTQFHLIKVIKQESLEFLRHFLSSVSSSNFQTDFIYLFIGFFMSAWVEYNVNNHYLNNTGKSKVVRQNLDLVENNTLFGY